MVSEFWKITELKKSLDILKEEPLKIKVTRWEDKDVETKIKLMEEAEEFGRQQRENEILEIINNIEFTNIVRMNSNLGANLTQDRIKEELKQKIKEKK